MNRGILNKNYLVKFSLIFLKKSNYSKKLHLSKIHFHKIKSLCDSR